MLGGCHCDGVLAPPECTYGAWKMMEGSSRVSYGGKVSDCCPEFDGR